METTTHIRETSKQTASAASKSPLARILQTSDSFSPFALRLTLATAMFPHGAQKLLGWWGGYGFESTMGYFTGSMGIPWIVSFAVIVFEFFGPLLLALGFGTRLAALALGAVMTGAMLTEQIQNGFFMNWLGNQTGEGIEYSILFLGIAIAVLISGSGRFALDRAIAKRLVDK